jgi:hypothetical protein
MKTSEGKNSGCKFLQYVSEVQKPRRDGGDDVEHCEFDRVVKA